MCHTTRSKHYCVSHRVSDKQVEKSCTKLVNRYTHSFPHKVQHILQLYWALSHSFWYLQCKNCKDIGKTLSSNHFSLFHRSKQRNWKVLDATGKTDHRLDPHDIWHGDCVAWERLEFRVVELLALYEQRIVDSLWTKVTTVLDKEWNRSLISDFSTVSSSQKREAEMSQMLENKDELFSTSSYKFQSILTFFVNKREQE